MSPSLAPGERTTLQIERPILVGYDGSPRSRRALAYAAGLTRRIGQPLLVVHVVPLYADYRAATAYPHLVAQETESLAWLRAELDDAGDTCGLSVHVAQTRSHRGRALERIAQRCQAEAVVLGAPRRRVRRVFGCVPVWLVRRARCPVIVVP